MSRKIILLSCFSSYAQNIAGIGRKQLFDVVIRSAPSAGDIKLTVTSPGLFAAALNIKTISAN